MLYIAGGTLLLPACLRQSGKVSIELVNLTVSEADEEMLEAFVETLIPSTDTPGGKELLLHLFVLKMVDDCHSPEDQQAFVDGLQSFADWAQQKLGIHFSKAKKRKREDLLKDVYGVNDDTLAKFLAITKRRAIQGYMNSRYVMTNLIKYELIPGRYNGYFPAEQEQSII